MNLYKNGHFVKTFKESRSIENLHDFLEPFMKKRVVEDVSSLIENEVTSSDVVQQAKPMFVPNQDGLVLSLDPSNFKSVMDQGPMFVKFFAPW